MCFGGYCLIDKYIKYMNQIRVEVEKRLIAIVYVHEYLTLISSYKEGDWSKKWWMTFANKNFMNLTLNLL